MVPESAWRRPMSASTSSVCPLPSTPAMPRTSPAWMVKEMSSSRALPPGANSRSASTVRTARSVTVDSAVSGVGSSLPTISSAS